MDMEIKEYISLAPYTVYNIGGPARFFAEPKKDTEIIEAIRFAKEKKLFFIVLGSGSNVLMSDKGFLGLALHITSGAIEHEGTMLVADAGVMMARLVAEATKNKFSGIEWGIGIPGSVGGSVRGNAGCFGGEIKDVVREVRVYDSATDKEKVFSSVDGEFSYRHSIFKSHPELIILSATLQLKEGDPQLIQQEIRRIVEARAMKQDIGTKCCGCIFKNVSWERKDINKERLISTFPMLSEFYDAPNIPASFLIDRAELKGKKIGHVYVSQKHANYFVNEGGARAEDVVMLISLVKDVVRRKFKILLEEEIQYVGF